MEGFTVLQGQQKRKWRKSLDEMHLGELVHLDQAVGFHALSFTTVVAAASRNALLKKKRVF